MMMEMTNKYEEEKNSYEANMEMMEEDSINFEKQENQKILKLIMKEVEEDLKNIKELQKK